MFASSLAAEDMVLTDLILRAKLPIGIFTLETGRLHKETLGMVDRIKETYGYDVAAVQAGSRRRSTPMCSRTA